LVSERRPAAGRSEPSESHTSCQDYGRDARAGRRQNCGDQGVRCTMRRIALALVAFLALGAALARAGLKIAPRPLVLGEVALIAPRHLTAARRAEVVIYAGATVY